MASYDPFARGPSPVGTRTLELHDAPRQRTLPVDVWYPAAARHRGEDLDDETRDRYRPLPMSPEVSQDAVRDAGAAEGPFPLVVFSHGFGGERRQSTHLCTHLASHGYVVAAMDHVGNTTNDMMQIQMSGAPPDPSLVHTFIADRPADASFVIDRLLAGDADLEIDPDRIGMSGHSFGGWTTLATTGRDRRIRAALPLAPAGGKTSASIGPDANRMHDSLDLSWDRDVPTLYLTAELDTLLPLDGMRDLLERTPGTRRGVVLLDSDHFHFCDRAEETHDLFKSIGAMMAGAAGEGAEAITALIGAMKTSAELCPGAHAYAMTCGLGLAHLDAHVRELAEAVAFMHQDLKQVMAERDVAVEHL